MAVVANIIAEFNPKGVNDATKSFEKLGKLVGGVFATRAVFNFAKDTLKAAEAAATSEARIKQIATSMGLFGNQTEAVTKRLVKLADATARATGIDQNAIKATQAKLLTFGELAKSATVVGGSFDRATQAAVDLAAAGFGSVEQNAIQLGKALQDPTKGITALARSGVTFTDSQKQMIRSMVEANDVLGAQNLVLKAIEQQVGGTAVATANDTDKMKVAFTQLKEQIGAQLVPAFAMALEAFIPLVEAFTALPGPIKQIVVVGGLAAVMFKSLSVSLQGVGLSAKTANLSLGAVGIALTAAVAIYSAYSRGKAKAKEITDNFTGALQAEKAGQRGATLELIARQIVESKSLRSREQLNISEREIADAIDGKTVPALQSLRAAYDAATSGGKSMDQANRLLTEQFGVGVYEVGLFLKEIDGLAGGLAAAREETAELDTVTTSLTTSTEDAAAAIGSVGDAADDTRSGIRKLTNSTDLARKAAEKLDAAWDELKGEIDEERAFLDIQQTFDDLRAAAVEAFIAVSTGADDATEKQRAFQNEVLDAREDVIKLGRDILGLPKSHVTRLQMLADQGQFDELERRIAILARNRTMNLDIQARGGIGYGVGQRAKGGPVSAGRPYLVGEQGPEIVVPSQSGTVLTASQTAAVATGNTAVGGGTTIVNIYPKTMPTLRELTDLVNEARRRGLAI
jgi:hypothetical protein